MFDFLSFRGKASPESGVHPCQLLLWKCKFLFTTYNERQGPLNNECYSVVEQFFSFKSTNAGIMEALSKFALLAVVGNAKNRQIRKDRKTDRSNELR